MTTTTTDTLFTLSVPTPWTQLQAGQGSVPGIDVRTDEHVRMYAKGLASASDAVAQATGQLWLQAVDDVVAMAKRKVLVSSRGNTFVNANRGITVMAGFKPDAILSEEWPGTFPEGVEGYDTSADIAGAVWTGFTVAVGIAATAAKVTETLVSSNFTWWQSLSANVNALGAGLNLLALGWKKDVRFPGINLWSQGGTLIGSTFSSVNVMGVGGVILAAPFLSAFALWSTKLRATKHVGLTSCGSVAIGAPYGGSLRSFLKTSMTARVGALKVIGTKRIECGVPNRPTQPYVPVVTFGKVVLPNPQQLSQTVTFQALKKIAVTALGTMTFDNLGIFGIASLAGTNTSIQGVSKVSLRGLSTFLIDIDTKGGISMSNVLASAFSITIDPMGVKIGGPAAKLACADASIKISALPNSVKIVPGVSLAVNGTTLALG